MRKKFVEKKFTAEHLEIIESANTILEEYEAQGITLTLRSVFYQFVSRGLMPNRQSEYKRLGSILSVARLAGLVDWSLMEDRIRSLDRRPRWGSTQEIALDTSRWYREDLWKGQPRRPEVWVEKDAIIGSVEAPCHELRLDFFACRGNASQSSIYEAAQRLRGYVAKEQEPTIFYFGDHDPNGMDMTRDVRDRLSLLAGFPVDLRRVALNMDQIERYQPPPNPVKESDSRSGGYVEEFGHECWELDALEPSVIGALIREHVLPLRDERRWKAMLKLETKNRGILRDVADRWDEVLELVS